MKTLISIVFHSDLDKLKSTIISIEKSEAGGTIVVLDASRDSIAFTALNHSTAIVIKNPRNGGFSWGHHQVFAQFGSDADVFVCANPDVTFTPSSLQTLIRHASENEGLYYPVQLTEHGEPATYSVHPTISLRDSAARWTGVGRKRRSREVLAAVSRTYGSRCVVRISPNLCGSGAVIAMRASTWRTTGGLSTDFFLFSEDREFGHRAAVAGVQSFLCGDALVIHPGGFRMQGVTAKGSCESVVSEQIYWSKWVDHPVFALITLQIIGIGARLIWATIRRDHRKIQTWRAVFKYRIWKMRLEPAAPRLADGFRRGVDL
ncbi:glycosyltransferase family 2 protein [Janibacter melonis]|uniref:glycosyltransferase family 2 protein n=1 Tax=Janibacter melonis TaxID=262209 RepID=UPI0037BE69A9